MIGMLSHRWATVDGSAVGSSDSISANDDSAAACACAVAATASASASAPLPSLAFAWLGRLLAWLVASTANSISHLAISRPVRPSVRSSVRPFLRHRNRSRRPARPFQARPWPFQALQSPLRTLRPFHTLRGLWSFIFHLRDFGPLHAIPAFSSPVTWFA